MPIGMMVHHSIIIQWALDPTSQSIYTMCVILSKNSQIFMKKRLTFHAENHQSHFLANEQSKFPMVFDTFLPLKKDLNLGGLLKLCDLAAVFIGFCARAAALLSKLHHRIAICFASNHLTHSPRVLLEQCDPFFLL